MIGICTLSIIPLRKEPAETNEMVTQLLFGETYQVLETTDNWMKIKLYADGYEGWINNKMFDNLDEPDFTRINNQINNIFYDISGFVYFHDKKIPILLGSSLSVVNNRHFKLGKKDFLIDDHLKIKSNFNNKTIIPDALRYLNAPYLWGGRTPFGIDCSGLVQVVFKLNNIKLPRDASQQANIGEEVEFAGCRETDLAFFCNKEGRIIHVGIILENSRIIHASGKVRIDKIDLTGIFNEETGLYSHQLHSIKRIKF